MNLIHPVVPDVPIPVADELRTRILTTLEVIGEAQWSLGKHYVELGCMVLQVRTNRYWQGWGYNNFGDYLEFLKVRLDRGRTTIYEMVGVAEALLPVISEADLTSMGLSKATELKRLKTQHPERALPADLIAKAVDPNVTVESLRKEMTSHNGVVMDHNGSFHDFGFFATEEEYREIEDALHLADRIDPVISKALPAVVRNKERLLRLSEEFISTYAPEAA